MITAMGPQSRARPGAGRQPLTHGVALTILFENMRRVGRHGYDEAFCEHAVKDLYDIGTLVQSKYGRGITVRFSFHTKNPIL